MGFYSEPHSVDYKGEDLDDQTKARDPLDLWLLPPMGSFSL
jgi:hypothetical protein